jgi:hypothetical protein
MAQAFGWNQTTELPTAGRRVQPQDGLIFYNNVTNVQEYVFVDSSSSGIVLSVFTERSINVTWECESHEVTQDGNGSFSDPSVANSAYILRFKLLDPKYYPEEVKLTWTSPIVGTIFVSQALPKSTTFFNNGNTTCPDRNPRCSVIEVLETSDTQPWYYRCNITLGTTQNDPQSLSYISDTMASFASASIAQGGFVGTFDDDSGTLQSAQVCSRCLNYSSSFGCLTTRKISRIAFQTDDSRRIVTTKKFTSPDDTDFEILTLDNSTK